jgi:aldehyde dehydrogenase (NAD+)
MEAHEVYSRQRRAWLADPFPEAGYRARAIRRVLDWVRSHREDIRAAVAADLGKPEPETDLTEVLPVIAEARHTMRRFRRWMRTRRVGTPLSLAGARSRVAVEPKGVVLIISPWNFPFNLALMPLVSALAAGNRCVVKPSELAPATSALVARMMGELFEPEEVAVVEGDAEVAKALLAEPFDHIFFTGSPRIGRRVMEAAARHLSSVTLELGGKSPAIVDASADPETAAERIVWAKYINAGQTCIAPDYVLVARTHHDRFVAAAETAVSRLYRDAAPERFAGNYSLIVTDRHADRLRSLIAEAREAGAAVRAPLDPAGPTDPGRTEPGRTNPGRTNPGRTNPGAAAGAGDAPAGEAGPRYLPPVLLTGVPPEAAVMREEIFGPVLPVLPVDSLDEALAFVRERAKPLAMYVFARTRLAADAAVRGAGAGGVCFNDALLHYMNPKLPFGGVGESGSGKAHGHSGFLEFSNRKPVLVQRRGFAVSKLVYPPYTASARRRVRLMMRLFGS